MTSTESVKSKASGAVVKMSYCVYMCYVLRFRLDACSLRMAQCVECEDHH